MGSFRGLGKGFAMAAAVCIAPAYFASFITSPPTSRPTSRYSRLSHCVRQDLGSFAGPVILLSLLLLGAFVFLCIHGAQRMFKVVSRITGPSLRPKTKRNSDFNFWDQWSRYSKEPAKREKTLDYFAPQPTHPRRTDRRKVWGGTIPTSFGGMMTREQDLYHLQSGVKRSVGSATSHSFTTTFPQMASSKSGITECSVCLDFKMPDAFPDKITDTCKHRTQTCTPCLGVMITSALGGKEWLEPECPECKAKLSIYDVQKFGIPTQAETFDKRQTMKYLQSLVEYRSCLGPGCPSGQLHEGGEDSPIVSCWSCGFKQCFTHRMPWDKHSGKTCEEVEADIQKRIEVEGVTKSEELIRRTSKICPGCKFDIEKTGGCEHMICQKCRYQFCFVCLASWTEIKENDNSRHEKTCTFWAPPGRA